MCVQQVLCELRWTVAVHGGTVQEAERLEDRRHLHAGQARLDAAKARMKWRIEGNRSKKCMGGVTEAYALVTDAICLDLYLFSVRIPTRGVLRSAFVFGERFPRPKIRASQSKSYLRPCLQSLYSVGNSSLRCNLLTISMKSLSFSLVRKPCLIKKSSTTSAQLGLNSPFSMACLTSSMDHR
jgi:hypothetical protein